MGGVFGGNNSTVETAKVAGFQVNNATYGLLVPVILGTSRQPANIIDHFNFKSYQHSSTQSTGKGGSETTTHTYTYKAAVVLGLCEGTAASVGRVWVDADLITTMTGAGLTFFNGARGQNVWAYVASTEPAGENIFYWLFGRIGEIIAGRDFTTHQLHYSGLAYAAGFIDLNSNGGVKNYNFEITGQLASTGDNVDINPADAAIYILSDVGNGLGFASGTTNSASVTAFRNYCHAADIYITLAMTDQKKAHDRINSLCELTNTIVFWSQSQIKFVPRCETALTANGVTYTPNTTPEYDLTDDDFLEQKDDGKLVTWERSDNSGTYNAVIVEFTNRANHYETESVEYQILTDINDRGLRQMPVVSYPEIHTKARAERVAQMIAMDSCFGRNMYQAKLGLAHSLLEPGDIVTLTDTTQGLDKLPVSVETITENGDDAYNLEFKYKPFGSYTAARYTAWDAERGLIDKNVAPGDVATPLFFETPFLDGSHNLGIAVCGVDSSTWGGCEVWASYDQTAYSRIGEITAASRYGKTTNLMTVGDDAVRVELTAPELQLLSASSVAADANATLIAIGNEWMAYQTADLTAWSDYLLMYIRRGLYGSAIAEHAIDTDFLRYDPDGFSYPYFVEDIGRTLYIKLLSFNIFKNNLQSMEDVTEYEYTIRGAGSMTRIERGTKSITVAGWTAFTFTTAYNAAPTLTVAPVTVGHVAYARNITASGFEALLYQPYDDTNAAGDLNYEAQGW